MQLKCAGSIPPKIARATHVEACLKIPDLGWLAEATPTHLAGMRELFLGRLTGEQTEQLERIWKTLLEGDLTYDRVAE